MCSFERYFFFQFYKTIKSLFEYSHTIEQFMFIQHATAITKGYFQFFFLFGYCFSYFLLVINVYIAESTLEWKTSCRNFISYQTKFNPTRLASDPQMFFISFLFIRNPNYYRRELSTEQFNVYSWIELSLGCMRTVLSCSCSFALEVIQCV